MKKLNIFILTLVFILTVSVGIYAEGLEVIGGMIYTTLNFDQLDNNDIVVYFNEEVDFYEEALEEEVGIEVHDYELDKLDKMNSGTGFFLGLAKDFDKIRIAGQYENFSASESGIIMYDVTEIDTPPVEYYAEINADIKTDVTGIYLSLGSGQFFKYFNISGGVGYYTGTGNMKMSYYAEEDGVPVDEGSFEADIDFENSIGYKIGVGVDYPLAESWSLAGNLNYRNLEMKGTAEASGSVPGPTVEPEEITEDFSGTELQIGLAYNF